MIGHNGQGGLLHRARCRATSLLNVCREREQIRLSFITNQQSRSSRQASQLTVVGLSFSIGLLTLFLATVGLAEVVMNIVPDGTTPTTQVIPNGATHFIIGGTRPGDGPNLFHSFGQFDVGTGSIASFFNETGLFTANIFNRVTGGQLSQIDGRLQTVGFGAANLFLMNPAGVVFGPNASLDIGGSFFVTNADYIKLADGKLFTATPSADDAVLSVAAPEAFGFLGPKPDSQGIQFNGSNLAVGALNAFGIFPGSVSAVGRDGDNAAGVQVTGGRLTANFGQINLASVASGGELNINTLQESPNINGQSFTQLGHVALSEGAQVTALAGGEQGIVIRGGVLTVEGGSTINSVSTPLGNGNVSIHADSVLMKDFSFQFNGQQFVPVQSGVFTFSLGGQQSGDVLINASSVALDNFATVGTPSFNLPGFNLNSGAGAITFEVDTLTASNFAQINSSTSTAAPAGDIMIRGRGGEGTAAQSVSLSSGATIQAKTLGAGAGGNITIDTARLTITGVDTGAENADNPNTGISADSSGQFKGKAGDITVNASESVTLSTEAGIRSTVSGAGPGGTVTINTNQLDIMDRSTIVTSTNSLFETGNAGDIRIQGAAGPGSQAQAVNITGRSALHADTFGNGDGGNITVHTDTLTVNNGGISAVSGSLNQQTDEVTAGTGAGGNITIEASTKATFSNSAVISADTAAQGDATLGPGAGTVLIRTPELEVNGAEIRSQTIGNRASGNLVLEADHVSVTGGRINANSGFRNLKTGMTHRGSGQAGNLIIRGEAGEGSRSQSVDISNFGTLQALTIGDGNGGSITINSDLVKLSDFASIAANSGTIDGTGTVIAGQGNAGAITIAAQDSVALANDSLITSSTVNGQGGTIAITGSDVQVTSQSTVQAVTIGEGQGGAVVVNADHVLIDGAGSGIRTNSGIVDLKFDQAQGGRVFVGSGQASDITIRGHGGEGTAAQSVDISNFGTLQALTIGDGNGGSITINSDLVKLSDFASIAANSGLTDGTGTVIAREGKAGDIQLAVGGSLTVEGGAQIQAATVGSGNAGSLSVTAQDVTISGIGATGFASGLFVNAESPGTNAQAGNLNLTASGSLTISDGGGIFGITSSKGQGANVSVTAGTITLDSGGAIATSTFGQGDNAGNAGLITVEATSGPINISGTLDTNRPIEPIRLAFSKSGIFSNAADLGNTGVAPNGNAGSISVTTPDSIILADQAEISTSADGNGQGGNITLTAGQEINVLDQSTISAESAGTGNAGNIRLEGQGLMLIQNSAILTNAAQADGGNITLKTPGFMIDIDNSTISGSVGGGATTLGANINIDPQWILIRNHSQILANAFEGQGGNITLRADFGIFQDTTSTISASSQFGTSGTVNVQAPIQNLNGVISPLSEDALRVAQLYAQQCAAQKGGKLSSFVQGGRSTLPSGPEETLASPLFLENPGGAGPFGLSNTSATGMAAQAQRLGFDVAGAAETLLLTAVASAQLNPFGCSL